MATRYDDAKIRMKGAAPMGSDSRVREAATNFGQSNIGAHTSSTTKQYGIALSDSVDGVVEIQIGGDLTSVEAYTDAFIKAGSSVTVILESGQFIVLSFQSIQEEIDGIDSRTYTIEAQVSTVERYLDGTVVPTTLTFDAYTRPNGGAERVAYPGYIVVQASDGSDTWVDITTSTGSSLTVQVEDIETAVPNVSNIRATLYDTNGGTRLAMDTVSFVDGVRNYITKNDAGLWVHEEEGNYDQGGYTRIAADGVHIGDNGVENASFSNDLIELGKNSENASISMLNGTGSIYLDQRTRRLSIESDRVQIIGSQTDERNYRATSYIVADSSTNSDGDIIQSSSTLGSGLTLATNPTSLNITTIQETNNETTSMISLIARADGLSQASLSLVSAPTGVVSSFNGAVRAQSLFSNTASNLNDALTVTNGNWPSSLTWDAISVLQFSPGVYKITSNNILSDNGGMLLITKDGSSGVYAHAIMDDGTSWSYSGGASGGWICESGGIADIYNGSSSQVTDTANGNTIALSDADYLTGNFRITNGGIECRVTGAVRFAYEAQFEGLQPSDAFGLCVSPSQTTLPLVQYNYGAGYVGSMSREIIRHVNRGDIYYLRGRVGGDRSGVTATVTPGNGRIMAQYI